MTVAVQISKGKDFNDEKTSLYIPSSISFITEWYGACIELKTFSWQLSLQFPTFFMAVSCMYFFIAGDGATLGGIFHLAL